MDNSTAFWNIIFPTISPFAIIIVFFLLWRIIRRLEQRKWKLITARVLRIEKIDKKDRDGVLEPRQYKLDLVFQWQGVDWHRSWIFPRIYDLPKAGDILQLRYHPQKEDFQLVTSLAEKQKIRHARLVLLLVIGIVIFVPSVLFGLLLFHLPQEQHILSESTVWLFFAAPLLVIFLVVRIYRAPPHPPQNRIGRISAYRCASPRIPQRQRGRCLRILSRQSQRSGKRSYPAHRL